MKIVIQSGESVTIVVPSDTHTSARVAIQTDRAPVATVVTDSGLIGDVQEHVCRSPLVSQRPNEDRLTLWAHLISEHSSCIGLDLPLADLVEIHEHEHDGPGTIRNHPREWRNANVARIVATLAESDSGLPSMNDSDLRLHAKRVEREVTERKAAKRAAENYVAKPTSQSDMDDCREED